MSTSDFSSEIWNGRQAPDRLPMRNRRYSLGLLRYGWCESFTVFDLKVTYWEHHPVLEYFKLEDAGTGCFLENVFSKIPDGNIRFRLKNANEDSLAVWRYHHYRSRVDYATKRATVFSTLRKVDRMASDPEQLTISAMAKCKEFLDLEYPPGILRYMCAALARETGHSSWSTVKRYIR